MLEQLKELNRQSRKRQVTLAMALYEGLITLKEFKRLVKEQRHDRLH